MTVREWIRIMIGIARGTWSERHKLETIAVFKIKTADELEDLRRARGWTESEISRVLNAQLKERVKRDKDTFQKRKAAGLPPIANITTEGYFGPSLVSIDGMLEEMRRYAFMRTPSIFLHEIGGPRSLAFDEARRRAAENAEAVKAGAARPEPETPPAPRADPGPCDVWAIGGVDAPGARVYCRNHEIDFVSPGPCPRGRGAVDLDQAFRESNRREGPAPF